MCLVYGIMIAHEHRGSVCNMKQLVRETGDREKEGEGVEAGEAGVGTGVKVGERDRDGRGGRGGRWG